MNIVSIAYREPELDAAAKSGIPILEVSDFLAGVPGARERLAAELRQALEQVGFYYIHGHGVSQALIDDVFAQCARFHARPLAEKMAIRGNEHNVGYMPVNGYVSRSSRVEKATRPNFVEAFFLKRDLPPDHPDVVAGVRYRCANPWPEADALPGFRETVAAYLDAMEHLCERMLPLYAAALDLDPDYFRDAFAEPQYTLRMSHYPPADQGDGDQYGLAPHTDSSFLTMLPQSELPGLSICMPSGEWTDALVVPGTFLVNSGDMLRRWTNHRFLSTPHRVVNRNAWPGSLRHPVLLRRDPQFSHGVPALVSGTGQPAPLRADHVRRVHALVRSAIRPRAGTRQSRTSRSRRPDRLVACITEIAGKMRRGDVYRQRGATTCRGGFQTRPPLGAGVSKLRQCVILVTASVEKPVYNAGMRGKPSCSSGIQRIAQFLRTGFFDKFGQLRGLGSVGAQALGNRLPRCTPDQVIAK